MAVRVTMVDKFKKEIRHDALCKYWADSCVLCMVPSAAIYERIPRQNACRPTQKHNRQRTALASEGEPRLRDTSKLHIAWKLVMRALRTD
jgi:hypothetical protein